MKNLLLFICFMFCASGIRAQTTIRGTIANKKGEAILGANIYFEGTFLGTTSDSSGYFRITTDSKDAAKLIIRYMGYQTWTYTTEPGDPQVDIKVVLQENRKDLGEVYITAGHFAAGDEQKSAVLSTLDMATASGGFGDIIHAISSLPGTSPEADEGGLMVRGGERYETATFIDDMLVDNAFTAKLPEVPVRGRFSPMLFRGTVFSTGGYSAEYGQALSSALLLNTISMPRKNDVFLTLHTGGLYLSGTRIAERAALSSTTCYTNMGPYYHITPSNILWEHAPENISQNLFFRKKTGTHGMLKAMAAYNFDNCSLRQKDINTGNYGSYSLKNHNGFGIITYKNKLGEKWILFGGLTGGYDFQKIGIQDTAGFMRSKKTSEVKLTLNGPLTQHIKIKTGGNLFLTCLNHQYAPDATHYNIISEYCHLLGAIYAETEISLGKRLFSKTGLRLERSYLTQKTYLTPRVALAFKTTKSSQVSFCYGQYYQEAQEDYLIYNRILSAEKAEHLIGNFQYMANGRIFRVEAYYKKYSSLVKYDSLYATEADAYSNDGTGYAKGIDLFFRDNKSIRNGDLWIAYSLMLSERNYQDNITMLTPEFISKHNISLAYKHYIAGIDAYLSLGYRYASGRPYIDPNISLIVQQKTKDYHNLSMSLFYFTEFLGQFCTLFAQVNNVLGTNQVFGYRYASKPNPDGIYTSEPILPVSRRFILAGVQISFTGQTDI